MILKYFILKLKMIRNFDKFQECMNSLKKFSNEQVYFEMRPSWANCFQDAYEFVEDNTIFSILYHKFIF